jgi:uncharacterized membrane protein
MAATADVAIHRPRRERPDAGPWRWIVAAASAAFVLLFGGLILLRHHRFGTQAFDLGIFDQGLWLLSRLESPYVTLRGLDLFADHSSYLAAPLAAIYRVWDDPRALLVLTVVVLALGAPLVYLAARGEGLRPVLATALAAGYLLHPATQWQAWDNFHPEVLAIPLLLAAFVAAQRQQWWWAVGLAALVLLAKEDAALVVVPFGIYLGWRWRRRTEAIALVIAGIGAALLNYLVLLPSFSPTGELLYTGRYDRFGEGLAGVAWGVLTKPSEVADTLATFSQLEYLAAMLLPLGLCLLAPEVLALGVPITLANMLSVHHYQHEIRWHYTAYLLAVVAMAAAVGTRRLVAHRPHVDGGKLAVAIVAAAFVGSLVAGPWPIGQPDPWRGWSRDPAATQRALDLIPGGAVVSADWRVANHLAHRRRIYEFPAPFRPPLSAWAAPGVPLPDPAEVEWVAVLPEVVADSAEVAAEVARLRADPAFEVVVDDDGLLLLRRR